MFENILFGAMDTITPTPPPTLTPTQVATHLYDALADGDLAAAVDLLDPDVVLHIPGTHAQAGVHRGLDAVIAVTAAITAATDDGEAFEVRDVLEGERHVAVLGRVTATRLGRRLDNSTIHLLRLRAGRVAEIHLHNFDGLAVDAFWS